MPIPADAWRPHFITSNGEPKTSLIRYDNTAKTAGIPQNTPAAITNRAPASRKDAMSAGDLRPRLSFPSKTQPIASVEISRVSIRANPINWMWANIRK